MPPKGKAKHLPFHVLRRSATLSSTTPVEVLHGEGLGVNGIDEETLGKFADLLQVFEENILERSRYSEGNNQNSIPPGSVLMISDDVVDKLFDTYYIRIFNELWPNSLSDESIGHHYFSSKLVKDRIKDAYKLFGGSLSGFDEPTFENCREAFEKQLRTVILRVGISIHIPSQLKKLGVGASTGRGGSLPEGRLRQEYVHVPGLEQVAVVTSKDSKHAITDAQGFGQIIKWTSDLIDNYRLNELQLKLAFIKEKKEGEFVMLVAGADRQQPVDEIPNGVVLSFNHYPAGARIMFYVTLAMIFLESHLKPWATDAELGDITAVHKALEAMAGDYENNEDDSNIDLVVDVTGKTSQVKKDFMGLCLSNYVTRCIHSGVMNMDKDRVAIFTAAFTVYSMADAAEDLDTEIPEDSDQYTRSSIDTYNKAVKTRNGLRSAFNSEVKRSKGLIYELLGVSQPEAAAEAVEPTAESVEAAAKAAESSQAALAAEISKLVEAAGNTSFHSHLTYYSRKLHSHRLVMGCFQRLPILEGVARASFARPQLTQSLGSQKME